MRVPLFAVHLCPYMSFTSLVAQMVKRLPAMRETRVRSLGWEDPLEKEMASHYSFLPGESHGFLAGYSPRGRKELDTTERLHFPFQYSCLENSMTEEPGGLSMGS